MQLTGTSRRTPEMGTLVLHLSHFLPVGGKLHGVTPKVSECFAHSALIRKFKKNIWLALSPSISSISFPLRRKLSQRVGTHLLSSGKVCPDPVEPMPVSHSQAQVADSLCSHHKVLSFNLASQKADTLSSASHSFVFQSAQSLGGEIQHCL